MTDTPTPTPTMTPTFTPSVTPTITISPSVTRTITPSPTLTRTATPSRTVTPSITPSPSAIVPEFPFMYEERKEFSKFDYADEEFDVEITNVLGFQVTLFSTSVPGVAAGNFLRQGNYYSKILSISGNVIIMDRILDWDVGDALVYKPIPVSLAYRPQDGDNPLIMKNYKDLIMFFRDAGFSSVTVAMGASNRNDTVDVVIQPRYYQDSWGNFEWGQMPWGGYNKVGGLQAMRTEGLPKAVAKSFWLKVSFKQSEAFSAFTLQGISIILDDISTRNK